LTPTEELTGRGDYRSNVDKRDRRKLFGLTNAHALTNDALHPQQSNTKLILNQLTDSLDPTIS
jgi:hypothetical protein